MKVEILSAFGMSLVVTPSSGLPLQGTVEVNQTGRQGARSLDHLNQTGRQGARSLDHLN